MSSITQLKGLVQRLLTLPLNLGAYILRLFGFLSITPPQVARRSRPQNEKCRFRLDNDSSDTLTLPDGRKLGYAQYGSLKGKSVFYLHGLPGSRIEGTWFHDLGLKLGARIIAADRPGYGWSSPHPGRTLLDFTKDLESLAKHLGIEKYAVLGVSGGGPYALACAAGSPRENLKGVSIVCGLGPPDIGMRGAQLLHRIAFPWGYRLGTATLFRWFWRMEPIGLIELDDEQRLELMLQPSRLSKMQEKDLEIMKDEDIIRAVLRGSREMFAQGYDTVRQDGKLMCYDFGFRIEDIRPDIPVNLWYGTLDKCIPCNHGVQIAARLGERANLRLLEETHTSIFFNNREAVLTELLKTL